MGGRLKILLPAMVAGGLLLAAPAAADRAMRVLYHETLAATAGNDAATDAPKSMTFDAFGRRFELELDNHAGLNRLHGRADLVMLKGRLAGQPRSWVRLMRRGRELSGMVWDGGETYVIEPAARAADSLVQPVAAPDRNVIYRLADTLLEGGRLSCAMGPRPEMSVVNAQSEMNSLVAELKSAAVLGAGFATYRMTLGAIADFEMFDDFGSVAATETTIMDRLQIVDGIFSEQVGVEIELADIEVFTSQAESNQVFTSGTDAVDLLESLADYRDDPASGQEQYGATHLLTGRDMTRMVNGSVDNSNAGIAYQGVAVNNNVIFGICDNDTATSVSESNFSVAISALLIAHEVAHNFGAPHDGEDPCQSAPAGFLMAPEIDAGSSNRDNFTQCSLDEMQILVDAAVDECLTLIPNEGVGVTGPSSVSETVDTQFSVSWQIANTGAMTATNVAAQLSVPAALELMTLTSSAGTCDAGLLSCDIGTIGSGSIRSVTATLRADSTGSSTLQITASADVDDDSSDNTASTTVNVAATSGQSSGGGGGGGAAGMPTMLSLALLCLLRRRLNEVE